MQINRSEIDSATGSKVRVLVMDSGVDESHPELEGAKIKHWQVGAGPFGGLTVHDDKGGDPYGHGTAVCTILYKNAPGIELHCLRVLDENIRGSSQFVLTGMQWAIEQGFDVINCSFGTSTRSFLENYKRIIDKAFCRNVWLVAACNNQDFRTEEYPAFFPSVLSTDFGAVEGLTLKRRKGFLVEFIARGSNVKVAWKNAAYRTISGSSFAAPHLAALAARLRQCRPDWNACQAKAALYDLALAE
jgi:subtilisin